MEKRHSINSSPEKIFKEATIYYENTLNKAGYINKLAYYAQAQVPRKLKTKIADEGYIV